MHQPMKSGLPRDALRMFSPLKMVPFLYISEGSPGFPVKRMSAIMAYQSEKPGFREQAAHPLNRRRFSVQRTVRPSGCAARAPEGCVTGPSSDRE